MAGFANKVYTGEQCEAMYLAVDRFKLRAAEVQNRARAGSLAPDLEPFEVPINSVRSIVRRERRRRAGLAVSAVAELPAHDAVEALRRRLVSAADHELRRWEGRQKRASTAKQAEEVTAGLRSVARLVKEAAAIPGPNDPRPASKDKRDTAKLPDGPTQAPAILAAFHNGSRSNGASHDPRTTISPNNREDGEQAGQGQGVLPQYAYKASTQTENEMDGAPGAP